MSQAYTRFLYAYATGAGAAFFLTFGEIMNNRKNSEFGVGFLCETPGTLSQKFLLCLVNGVTFPFHFLEGFRMSIRKSVHQSLTEK